MNIAYSKTRERFPLSKKKIIKKSIPNALYFSIIVMFLFFQIMLIITAKKYGTPPNLSSNDMPTIILYALLVFTALCAINYFLNYLYQKWYFSTYFYDLTNDYIQIKKGIITPREITIPYERIQDIYVDQDILDRLFSLYDVHLSSATISSGKEAHIDGLEKKHAEELRNLLLDTVRQKIGKGPDSTTINTTSNLENNHESGN